MCVPRCWKLAGCRFHLPMIEHVAKGHRRHIRLASVSQCTRLSFHYRIQTAACHPARKGTIVASGPGGIGKELTFLSRYLLDE